MLTKAAFTGRVNALLLGADRQAGLEKSRADRLDLGLVGIIGDCHSGLTRKSDVRTIKIYPRNSDICNVRQLTLLSVEELAEIAAAMKIPELKPEWIGANIVTSGIPRLTLIPPSTRLQFPSGATLVVDMENAPCRQIADVIRRHHPDEAPRFVKAAQHRRGITAWVEREGTIHAGDTITLFIPPQRIYSTT